jgi:DNA-binding GntR family transcriptional regulator
MSAPEATTEETNQRQAFGYIWRVLESATFCWRASNQSGACQTRRNRQKSENYKIINALKLAEPPGNMNLKIAARSRRAHPTKGARLTDTSANTDSGHPLYAQIERVLKQEIVGGVYSVGSQFPTEDELSARFSVSRHTVREALRRLRDADLISSRRGAGTVVVSPRASGSYHVMSIDDLLAYAAAAAGRFAIESIGMIRVDAALAARTGLKRGEEWLAVCGLAYMKGDAPFNWNEYYINRDYAAVGRLLQRNTSQPIFPLIEDLFGVRIDKVDQEIGAALMSPAMAKSLGVEPETAALEIRRTFRTADGNIAQVTINTHPAALFRHSMTMRRVKKS